MADIEDIATDKVAGVPAWAWAVGIAGIVVGVIWWRNRSASAPAVVATDPANVEGTGMPSTTAVGVPAAGAGTGTATTQDDWLQNALSSATASGTDALTATDALAGFLTGQTLTPDQSKIVSGAIASQGLPPNPDLSAIVSATAPAAPAVNPFLARIESITGYLTADQAAQAERNRQASSLEAEARGEKVAGTRNALLAQAAKLRASANAEQNAINTDSATLASLQAQSAAWKG